MANPNPPEQHKQSSGPDMPHIQGKSMGGVSGNRPHHTSKRMSDGYKSKGLNPNDALSVTKAR